ncbi:MAG: hypothetical protein US50_C0006G0003 [Candidatus Nomurabacteria bacterium GW2011_GWB1_37_5]|uniref:Uncharacterized protein n=1 Tax=Candidatus Nomurabacteria bacterium GW2011_GWB1_37_5 TaxID=1618742 RepID=A0A0G0HB34_9BACT|nr:MAG: hypothetical protein US50_C0006G0003 [Candidatus Nomurabacteria bacterium GW2011_GWB1_37_5]
MKLGGAPSIKTNKEEGPKTLEKMLPFLKDSNEGKEFTEEQTEQFIKARENIAKQIGYNIQRNDSSKYFNLSKGNFEIHIEHYMTSTTDRGFKNGRIKELTIADKKNPQQDIYGFYGTNLLVGTDQNAKKMFDEIVKYFN